MNLLSETSAKLKNEKIIIIVVNIKKGHSITGHQGPRGE
jgi:hypothetical protein